MSSVLKVDNIEKYYGSKANLTKAIDRISFEVEEGEYIGIMGASGSGKTTLLNCISTIDQVTAGNIMINGMDITKLKGKHLSRFRREELGFIFQDFNLLDTLTAFENIALALTIMKIPAREIEDRVRSIAEKLMITEVLNKYPYQMSGGSPMSGSSSASTAQRAALAVSGGALWARAGSGIAVSAMLSARTMLMSRFCIRSSPFQAPSKPGAFVVPSVPRFARFGRFWARIAPQMR